jgi:hypothetical protein
MDTLKYDTFNYNPWLYLGSNIFSFYGLFYPIIISFTAFSYVNIEYNNNGFKQLFLLPVRKSKLYLAKLVVFIFSIIVSIFIAFFSFKIGFNLLGVWAPNLGFQNYDNSELINLYFAKMLIGSICIGVIQFAFSLKFPNFIISVGLALFLTLFSNLFQKLEYVNVIPYKFINAAVLDYRMEDKTIYTQELFLSFIYIIIFGVIGLYFFKNIKSE